VSCLFDCPADDIAEVALETAALVCALERRMVRGVCSQQTRVTASLAQNRGSLEEALEYALGEQTVVARSGEVAVHQNGQTVKKEVAACPL
jgi:hypothetical protein